MTPRPEVRHIVRNQSSRNGTKPLLIVLHSTESLNQPKAQASSHTCNDAQGNDARYVPDNRKAWPAPATTRCRSTTSRSAPPLRQTWPEAQLRNTAEWVAYWSKLHRIPIQRGRVGSGQVIKPGVVMHSELGAIGGGHHDPGVLYPIDRVISYALELSPDVRKQKVWRAHLTTARAMLKSLLAIRARMRQNHLESGYAPTTQQLNALRKTITTLKRLIGGSK
jgi:N-acetyl-anhydromuramyl-L-alanine amidase AmpD